MKALVPFLLLGFSSAVMSAQQVALFKDKGFQGDHIFVTDDWNCNRNLDYCYNISSIRVPIGWEIWAFEDRNFQGDKLILQSSWDGRGQDDWQWVNDIRSIRVVKKKTVHGDWQKGVALFKDTDLGGDHIFISDEWNCESNPSLCNDISSVYVPEGWEVWIYDRTNFKGEVRILTESWNGLGADDWMWNNQVKSVRIIGKPLAMCNQSLTMYHGVTGQSVVLWEHDYKGKQKQIKSDWTIGGREGYDFNDIISSIEVPHGLKVIAYEHANWEGISIEITGKWIPNSWDDFWNDRISSIRIEKL